MNVKNLREHYEELISHMESAGYSKNYIQVIRREIRLILESPDKWDSYDDIIQMYERIFDSNKAEKLRTIIRLIARFDLDKKLPRDPESPKDWNYFDNAYLHLNEEYSGLIDYYRLHADRNIKKETTIYNETRNTAAFLYKLQSRGIQSLEEINEHIIIEALTGPDGLPSKSASYVDQIRSVFRGSIAYSSECSRVFYLLPSIRKRRKNIQFLKPDERASIKRVLHKEDGSISLRDKAIGCLFYYTGLRCSDISNLCLSDIDWEKEEISIVQQKTGVPVKLPLTKTVGNAIYDYLTAERLNSDCEYIFLSQSYPFGKLSPATVGARSDVLYKEASIRQNPGDRRGGHIFRHNFATSMLEKGASRTTISHAIGHISPDSTEGYLAADMVHLKEYALSIEEFPVREGVFTSERI